MRASTIAKGSVITIAGAVLGLAVAGGVSATAGLNRSQEPAPVFPQNARGMTYGSSLDAISPETEPDLILATGNNGRLGYVRATDVTPVSPATPEEAIAQNGAPARTVPLYARDGVTVIDSFTMTAADPSLAVVSTE